MTQEITLTRPDDWHLHVRDGDALHTVVPHTAAQFGRAIIMPNLRPPVTTAAQALAYRERILAAVPAGVSFRAADDAVPDRQPAAPTRSQRAKDAGVVAVKLYPAGATTNSDAGVTDLRKTYKTLEAMQRAGLLLLVHGEVTSPDIDLFDREAVFIDTQLIPLRRDFPELKIVFEHITTQGGRAVRAATPTASPAPPSPRTTCSTTATPSSPAASARTTTACRCSSAKPTARRWCRRPPRATSASSWAPTARRTRRT